MHAIALGDVLGGDVFRTDQRNQAIDFQIRESPFPAGDGSFGCETLPPVVAPQVVSDLL
jgi:hypothetical protein